MAKIIGCIKENVFHNYSSRSVVHDLCVYVKISWISYKQINWLVTKLVKICH